MSSDAEQQAIVGEEEKVLARVQKNLETREMRTVVEGGIDYDKEMLILRDAINEARLEDIPPLLEEMERLQGVAARRAEVSESHIDPNSPYFGRLVLEEGDRKREVLIGRGTYLDSRTGVRIVDWRDAPVSRLYYRYDEGDDYDEEFGGREVEGEVLVRRSLAIAHGRLRRIGCPQGIFVRTHQGEWLRASDGARLAGGQGAAPRPEHHQKPSGKLGIGGDNERSADKFLPEIAAMIDPRQFELITRPSSGLVVIQGGAGSGKTTIGLHRLAYLAYQEPRRFKKDRMLVVVFNKALARYISRVLPALGVPAVPVVIYEDWVRKLRQSHFPLLMKDVAEDTPAVVTRLKKHPVMLTLIEQRLEQMAQTVEDDLAGAVSDEADRKLLLSAWRQSKQYALSLRLDALSRWAATDKSKLSSDVRRAVQGGVSLHKRSLDDVLGVWSEILTDRDLLGRAFEAHAPEEFTARELDEAHKWCARRCPVIVTEWEERRDEGQRAEEAKRGNSSEEGSGIRAGDGQIESDTDEREIPSTIDYEDESLLLMLHQRLRGPLMNARGRDALKYEHILVDEAQDLSPVELSVVMSTATEQRSVTLAGDVAQRLHMDNGFSSWAGVMEQLGLSHVEVEPLRLSYRSTHEIMDFANSVLGPLAPEEPGRATRSGVPVELFQYAHSGDAVGELGEALRDLARAEPLASIAVLARYPEQADLYYNGLKNAEVPNLRRISDQEFPFRPGVDVTDVRQVKGLEFDYVVLLEVNTASYPTSPEARHLLHIAGTRAAHQLWLSCTGEPSELVPQLLRERGY